MTPSLLVPFTDGVQLEFVYSLGGRLAVNRLWLLNRQPPTTQIQLDALAVAAADYWALGLMPVLSNALRLELVRATSWDVPLAGVSGFVTPLVYGGSISPSHSANVAIRVSWQSARPDPVKDGGNFVPGIPDDQVSVNTYSPEIRSAIFEHYAGIIDAAREWGDSPAWRWVSASLVENGVLRSEMKVKRTDFILLRSMYVTQQRHRMRL